MSEKIKIKRIKKDSSVDISVSESFYECTKQLMFGLLDQQANPQEFIQVVTDLKPEQERTFEQAIYEVFMSIVATVERKALELELIEEVEIDAPDFESMATNQDPS